ncbi:MAG: PAS domain S-box protein [Burkholderiales bacterium]|nr:PAS domain S-box protein [Burkholderiales bacterium]
MPVRRRRARKPSRSNRSQAAQDRGLAILQQALGVCTWVWDVRRDRVTWYGDLSPLLGLPAGAFSGRFADYLAHVHPEDRERAREIYVACLRGDCDQYRNEERIVLPDGSVRWLETFGRARRSARGRTIEMSGVVLDCSARKALEARAARIEQRHTAILEAMQTPLIVSRRRDGVVVAVNRAWERERGVPRERVLGRPGAAIGHWCDLSERERIVRAVDEHGAVSEVPVRIRRADGTVRDVRVSCVAVELDGEPHLVWSPRDVTAELAAERKFATLFATSPVAIALATADGRHLEVNDAWERMTGIARERALGASAAELGIWAEPAERLEALARLQADGALANFAARFRRADGALLDALVWAAPLELGSERCVLWVWSDVTEQQVQQRLLVEVARAVSPASAGAFLEELVARLAAELRADAVFVGELVGPANDRVRALAVWRDGARGAPFDIPLAGSACESVIEHADTVVLAAGAGERFARDAGLAQLGAEGYAGAALFDSRGAPLGVLVAVSRRPLERPTLWRTALEIFAARAAAEIERARLETELRALAATLERRVAERTASLEAANGNSRASPIRCRTICARRCARSPASRICCARTSARRSPASRAATSRGSSKTRCASAGCSMRCSSYRAAAARRSIPGRSTCARWSSRCSPSCPRRSRPRWCSGRCRRRRPTPRSFVRCG